MAVELWTLDGSDQDYEDVITMLRMVLGAAAENEMVHPETISSLRLWCNAEWKRIHPRAPEMTHGQYLMSRLRRNPLWPFWESLQVDEEVRWTGTKNATYFVVDPRPVPSIPGTAHQGAYIELRRHSGKTFWVHIATVRPLPDEGS